MITLHRAPWVLPISSPLIADGAVIVDDSRILAVGAYADFRHGAHEMMVDHEARILMPGLVNCHCHLELSPFAELTKKPVESGNMAAWIANLLALRAGMGNIHTDIEICKTTLADQYTEGVGLLVDIGNALFPQIAEPEGVEVHYFTELLGLSQQGTEQGLKIIADNDLSHKFTCHAPYSTSSTLLQAVKKRARQTGRLYPIHVAESRDEVDFLLSGQGRFRIFLEERGVWDGSFAAPGTGSINYLNRLDLLDDRTLCVHCVHLDDDEVDLLAEKNAKVCLCPGSNRFLGVGQAAPAKMLAAGIRPGLGTDSLASNPELSMWREMTILAEDHPKLNPETILAMATLYGAEAIGEQGKGCLAAGSSSRFLGVCFEGREPLEFLVRDHGAKDIIRL